MSEQEALLEWAREQWAESVRMAQTTTGSDHAHWLDEGNKWHQIISALRSQAALAHWHLCAAHQPAVWESDGTCPICEGHRLYKAQAALVAALEGMITVYDFNSADIMKTYDPVQIVAQARAALALVKGTPPLPVRPTQETNDGAGLIGQAIPDVAGTEPRPTLEQFLAHYRQWCEVGNESRGEWFWLDQIEDQLGRERYRQIMHGDKPNV